MNLPSDAKVSGFDLKMTVLGKQDPMNPSVYPKQIKIQPDKQQRFSITYNCNQLLDKTGGKPYYDTVKVIISDYSDFSTEASDAEIAFEYMVVCDAQ